MTIKMALAAVASFVAASAVPASAADLDIVDGVGNGAVVVRVHNRGFRHCHWIDGDRVCHRRYAAYDYDDWDGPYDGYGYGSVYGYGWGPSVVLGFGGRGGYGWNGGYGGWGGGGHRGGGWGGGGHGGHHR